MENYLYFGTGLGANATLESALFKASSFVGVEPVSTTTTRIYFKSGINDNHATAQVADYVEVTHAVYNVAGSYHRCKLIANAMAEAINAGPHSDGKSISIIDVDNGVYFGNITDIIGDASFGITIALDS
tara:strand:+ start:402 stop:788 length:387 start_codon:yes stop_codon:yes gene_type:complete